MKFKLNGVEREMERDTTVAQVVAEITKDPSRVAVERNRLIVPRVEWEYAIVEEGRSPEKAHRALMERDPKPEEWS